MKEEGSKEGRPAVRVSGWSNY